MLLIGAAWILVLTACVSGQDGFASLNGGTTGGTGGPTVHVSTEAQLVAACKDDSSRIIKITKLIPLTAPVLVGSNKSILGANSEAGVTGSGFYINKKKNVIIRGLKISKAVAPDDGVSIDKSTNVWIDHNEFFSDLSKGKDFYDGMVDAKHGSDLITISWNKFHDHWKTSLVGHADTNEAEDKGKLRITYHHNWFLNCNSRLPSIRFGTGHIYNNVYENVGGSGVNSRMGAQVLVERNIFSNVKAPIVTNLDSAKPGFAVERDNDLGGSRAEITQQGSFTKPPYSYTKDSLSNIKTNVPKGAGTTISFP